MADKDGGAEGTEHNARERQKVECLLAFKEDLALKRLNGDGFFSFFNRWIGNEHANTFPIPEWCLTSPPADYTEGTSALIMETTDWFTLNNGDDTSGPAQARYRIAFTFLSGHGWRHQGDNQRLPEDADMLTLQPEDFQAGVQFAPVDWRLIQCNGGKCRLHGLDTGIYCTSCNGDLTLALAFVWPHVFSLKYSDLTKDHVVFIERETRRLSK